MIFVSSVCQCIFVCAFIFFLYGNEKEDSFDFVYFQEKGKFVIFCLIPKCSG